MMWLFFKLSNCLSLLKLCGIQLLEKNCCLYYKLLYKCVIVSVSVPTLTAFYYSNFVIEWCVLRGIMQMRWLYMLLTGIYEVNESQGQILTGFKDWIEYPAKNWPYTAASQTFG